MASWCSSWESTITERDTNSRFHRPTEIEIDDMLECKDSINTRRATKGAVKCFRDFLSESGREDVEFEEYKKSVLDIALTEFYAGARKADGTRFKRSALQNIRYGIKRHLKEKKNVDILTDSAFFRSNDVFLAVASDLKRQGLGKVDHHPPILKTDIKKLYSGKTPVFDTNTPHGLQRKVMFEISFFLQNSIYFKGSNTGRENLRSMKRALFRVGTDETGRRYVFHYRDEDERNPKSGKEVRMYERKGSKNCPVESCIKYLSKLHPQSEDMWQRPKDSVDESDETWYLQGPIGKNALGNFMDFISNLAKLSCEYKNHSVRITPVDALDDAGIYDSPDDPPAFLHNLSIPSTQPTVSSVTDSRNSIYIPISTGVPDMLTLNIGGMLYTTTKSTLAQYPDSKLCAMLNHNSSVDGTLFFDRDGQIFRHILNFLRSGCLSLPDSFKELELLQKEAEFYQIYELMNILEHMKEEKIIKEVQKEENKRNFFILEVTECVSVADLHVGKISTSADGTMTHIEEVNVHNDSAACKHKCVYVEGRKFLIEHYVCDLEDPEKPSNENYVIRKQYPYSRISLQEKLLSRGWELKGSSVSSVSECQLRDHDRIPTLIIRDQFYISHHQHELNVD